jgi:hypothetical protein
MSPVGYKVGTAGPEQIEEYHHGYHDKKEMVQLSRKKTFYGVLGHDRKGQIRGGDKKSGGHVRGKEFPVGTVIGDKNAERRFRCHRRAFGAILIFHTLI